jgi:hypothetical protein
MRRPSDGPVWEDLDLCVPTDCFRLLWVGVAGAAESRGQGRLLVLVVAGMVDETEATLEFTSADAAGAAGDGRYSPYLLAPWHSR